MAEMILPGTYIEVRAEGLTIPGPISVGNLGVVGTAKKGPINEAVILGSLHDARNHFGDYDAWGEKDENGYTLVRALEQAYQHGATTVFAVRVAGKDENKPKESAITLKNDQEKAVIKVFAQSIGSWGNDLKIGVEIFEKTDTETECAKVTINYGAETEVYTVETWQELLEAINLSSEWVNAVVEDDDEDLNTLPTAIELSQFTGGNNGVDGADYNEGLEVLLNEPAHIIVAAGQDAVGSGADLANHCQNASTDAYQRERIAVVGSGPKADIGDLLDHNLKSDRVIFVGPGIKAMDGAASPPAEITLPGAYTAAAIAGMISALPAHRSPTNKALHVRGLEHVFNKSELALLVQANVLVLEQRQGIKVVKGVTTAEDSAWRQITTRRIVDFAKFGVRSAANPFIGKLNNERVRAALKGSISSFLGDMIDREMLTFYDLEVNATREQEISGMVEVLLVLQPTFSIDYVRVVMFLQ